MQQGVRLALVVVYYFGLRYILYIQVSLPTI